MLPLRKILSNKRSGKSGSLSSAEVTSASDDFGTPETVQVQQPYLHPLETGIPGICTLTWSDLCLSPPGSSISAVLAVHGGCFE